MRFLLPVLFLTGLVLAFFSTVALGGTVPIVEVGEFKGIVVDARRQPIEGVTVTIRKGTVTVVAKTDAQGRFEASIEAASEVGPVTIAVSGRNLEPVERTVGANDRPDAIEIQADYVVDPIHDAIIIEASSFDPTIDRRNEAIYRDTLFSRDDQVFQTLDAGINAGQHEGGGKSLEIRRFGFNLDHGGVNGGLKVLVDDVQQNQGTQGHGQGYLGQLKSLIPELVQEVNILNGPFSSEYGDFSGLGVVRIRLKESLPEQLFVRIQGGSFNTGRGFLGYSPNISKGNALFGFESSSTDGPFRNPLGYRRDNLTGSFTRQIGDRNTFGIKFNVGRNDFTSSGQIPLDLVAAGQLDRFGFIDPTLGGRVRSATFSGYFKHDFANGGVLKVDGLLGRSLFDLYSNFTFFLNDPVNGDQVLQHDSRLQEGVNAQYLKPFRIFGQSSLFIAGGNLLANQILVGLDKTVRRDPVQQLTRANARVTNGAGYVQQGIDLLAGRLHIDGGVRIDRFQFTVNDRVVPGFSGSQGAVKVQPKFNVALTPGFRFPLTFHFNYGRGIASQDARGVVQRPETARVSTTDFYQAGVSHHSRRFSFSATMFLIDASNQQVYIPDDGTIELAGPSRSYGFETKASINLTRFLSFNGGLTRVTNAFFRGTTPRVYIDSAPHTVANGALTLAGIDGFSGSLRLRYISNYRLDGEDPTIRASGFTVLDFNLVKRIRPWIDFNLSIDNLTGKSFFETQNFLESRSAPNAPIIGRVHGTPGYPRTFSLGFSLRLFRK